MTTTKFVPPTSDQVNASFQETQGVVERTVDPSGLIQGISGLAKAGVKLYDAHQIGELNEDMQKLSDEYMSQQPSYTANDQQVMDQFGSEIKRYQDMANATGRTSEFRTRAEALMKKHIADNPHLATEIRKASYGTLGFDPTGESIRQQMASIQQTAKTGQDALKAINDRAVKEFKMPEGAVFTPEGQKRYQMYIADAEFIARKKQENEIATLMLNNGTPPAVMKQNFNNESLEYTRTFTLGAQGVVESSLQELGLPPELKWENISKLDPNQKAAIQNALVMYKQEQIGFYRNNAGDMPEATYQNAMSERLAGVDNMIDALTNERSLKIAQNNRALSDEMTMRQILDNKAMKGLYFANKIGLDMTALTKANVSDHGMRFLSNLFVQDIDSPTEGVDTTQVTPTDVKAVGAELKKIMLEGTQTGDPETIAAGQDAYAKMAEMFASGKTYDAKTMNEYVNFINDPENTQFMVSVVSQDAGVNSAVNTALKRHVNDMAAAAVEQIPEYMPREIASAATSGKLAGRDGKAGIPGLSFSYKDGKFSVALDESVFNNDPRGILKRRANGFLNVLNKNLVTPLNRSINASATVFQQDADTAARELVKKHGFLFDALPVDEEATNDQARVMVNFDENGMLA